MNRNERRSEIRPKQPFSRSTRLMFSALAVAFLIVIGIILLLRSTHTAVNQNVADARSERAASTDQLAGLSGPPNSRLPRPASRLTAEEIVARRFNQFARKRRELVHALAEHFKVTVPDDVQRFFDAAEAGNYEELQALFEQLAKRRASEDGNEMAPYWRAMVETSGVAQQVQKWPAQELLDYGNSVLGALKPGMVYLGGSDSGCFIPTLLNETNPGEQKIILTQNGLADTSYLDYISFLYGDRMQMLTSVDSQQAFQAYIEDARKRATHDAQFPTEPKQVRPGENIQIEDGRVSIGGTRAVMTVNELLLETMLQKNPDLSFALEESFPIPSTYSNAAPLGPLIELRAGESQPALTPDVAQRSVAGWRSAAETLLSNPAILNSPDALAAYCKLAAAQGNLFAANGLSRHAEEIYATALQIHPSNPSAIKGYLELLQAQNRQAEAAALLQNALRLDPGNKEFQTLMAGTRQ